MSEIEWDEWLEKNTVEEQPDYTSVYEKSYLAPCFEEEVKEYRTTINCEEKLDEMCYNTNLNQQK